MNPSVPRLRMFAGPNGSGKSTLKAVLRDDLWGFYINPDDIEALLKVSGSLCFDAYNIEVASIELFNYFQNSSFLNHLGLSESAKQFSFTDNSIYMNNVEVNSYYASVLADFIRRQLLKAEQTFTFETVMSSEDKLDFLEKAQYMGFRTYLYYIATEDPLINVKRVNHRVKQGGHPVPEDKIVSRYFRSLKLLKQALKFTHRAYIFDNSGSERIWIAEVTEGSRLEYKTNVLPLWFQTALRQH